MKRQITLVVCLLIAVIGLGAYAVVHAEHQPKAAGITVQQALQQRNNALFDLKIQDQIAKTHEQAATNQISDLNAKIASLCIEVKAAHRTSPLCQ